MKSKLTRDLGIGAIFILIFVIATVMRLFGILESYQQFVVVLVSAAATYVIVAITMASQAEQQKSLLQQQTDNERRKEKETKIFEEKLRIYQEFLHFLCEVIKDGEVSKEEAIQLEFQTSYITMHTESGHVKEIAKRVEAIVNNLKSDVVPNKSANAAENEANSNGELMRNLFDIVNEFRKELYPGSPQMDEDDRNRSEAVKAFGQIMDAVEVKQEEVVANVPDENTAIFPQQNLADFATELIGKVNVDVAFWTVESCLTDSDIYINFAQKGNENGLRVILNSEPNGEHYFQIHMEYENTHEAYKHMKWRFGGRQNKWCWWKYLDAPYRTVAETDDIKTRNWGGLLNTLAKQLTALIAYAETFQKVTQQIYYPSLTEKAEVWMYYETCVAFDYEKSLGDDRFFMDVILQHDGTYNIELGNRDNDFTKLISRLHAIGFENATEAQIQGCNFVAYTALSAEETTATIAAIHAKI